MAAGEKADAKYLGVHFTGKEIKLGMVGRNGVVLQPRHHTVARLQKNSAAGLLVAAIEEYLRDWNGEPPVAIGLGLPGFFDRAKKWAYSIIADISTPVDIKDMAKTRFGVPISADNDVYATTLAIKNFDVGRVTDHFIVFHVDSYVAAGIVCDGRIVRGGGNIGGEIGHMCVESMGEPCRCGHRGCLENIVSSHCLIQQAEKLLPLYPHSPLGALKSSGSLNLDALFDCAQEGDELASRVTRRAVKALGVALVNLVNLVSPQHIVFLGEVVKNPYFFEQVRQYIFEGCLISSINGLLGYSVADLKEKNIDICGAAGLCFLE
jgi:glucokinase